MLLLKSTKQEVIELNWLAESPCPYDKNTYMRVMILQQGRNKKPIEPKLRKARFGGMKGTVCIVRKSQVLHVDDKRGYADERKTDVGQENTSAKTA